MDLTGTRGTTLKAPKLRSGKVLITTNEQIFNGGTPPAKQWTYWGQEDVQPFSDDVTKIGELQ